MTAPPTRRRWRKRKRTWAAMLLWPVIAYPLSTGPANYATRRRWVSVETYRTAYGPLIETDLRLDPHRTGRFDLFHRYVGWWADHAHAASD